MLATCEKLSTSDDTNKLAQKKNAMRTAATKKNTLFGLFLYTGSLSSPLTSVPLHMMSCQLSPVEIMNIATEA